MNKGLIVSIQEYSQQTTIELAARCISNKAVAIRTDVDITWLKMHYDFSIIALKKLEKKYYITTSTESINSCKWGDYIAIDSRRGNNDLNFLYVYAFYQNKKKIIADIENIEDVKNILRQNEKKLIELPKYFATTFSFLKMGNPDIELIKNIKNLCDIPIIAEGKYKTLDQIKKAYEFGANNICIGSEISNIKYLMNKFMDN